MMQWPLFLGQSKLCRKLQLRHPTNRRPEQVYLTAARAYVYAHTVNLGLPSICHDLESPRGIQVTGRTQELMGSCRTSVSGQLFFPSVHSVGGGLEGLTGDRSICLKVADLTDTTKAWTE